MRVRDRLDRHLPGRLVGKPHGQRGLAGIADQAESVDQRRPAEYLRAYPRDLLVIVTADERLDRGEHLIDRVPAHAQHLRADHLAVGLGGRGHEQALAEPVELDRQAQLRVLIAFARQDERVPVAEWPQQPHHAGQDLGVRQAGHILGEPGNRGVELRLRYLAERRIRPSLDLTGEERQVGTPALVARQAVVSMMPSISRTVSSPSSGSQCSSFFGRPRSRKPRRSARRSSRTAPS